jgi:ribosomal protein S12 methylthiotransferase
MQEIPEIDKLYGKFDWNKFIEELPDKSKKGGTKEWERTITTQPHTAYLKISEGCNRMCAFCAIPLITGRHKSRPEEEIIAEVKSLVSRGVKEFNIIAQDLSSYGLDLYGEHRLAQLIDKIADVEGVEWIRLHYAYPTDFPHDILDVMSRRSNVCKYLDIALQHCSDNVLEAMRRHIDKAHTVELLNEIRSKVPGIKIRTTLMVGFPGETEENFEELLQFVREQRFDRMGAFAYCEEDDTYAARHLTDSISDEEKQRRLDKLMAVQEGIAEELANAEVGKRVRLLVDEVKDGVATCRSEWDSPEVDLTYTVNNCDANPGDFIEAEVTASYTFDFEAKQI